MNFLFFIFGKQLAKYLYFYKTLKNYFFFFNLKTIFKTKYKKTWLKWVVSFYLDFIFNSILLLFNDLY